MLTAHSDQSESIYFVSSSEGTNILTPILCPPSAQYILLCFYYITWMPRGSYKTLNGPYCSFKPLIDWTLLWTEEASGMF